MGMMIKTNAYKPKNNMHQKADHFPELETIKQVGRSLESPLFVRSVQMKKGSSSFSWADLSLANGYPSLVLLFNELNGQFPNEGWDFILHGYVEQMIEDIEMKEIKNYSLFQGLAGICFALATISQEKKSYEVVLSGLNKRLVDWMKQEILATKRPVSFDHQNLWQGMVGIGIYFLNNVHLPPMQDALVHLLQFLISNLEDCNRGPFPLGLAIGLSGILAFLSICSLKGFTVKGQLEAIQVITKEIQEKAVALKGDVFWLNCQGIKPYPYDWFEGKCGILRSLYLAGAATHDVKLKEYSYFYFSHLFETNEEIHPFSELFHENILFLSAKHMAKDAKDLHLWGKATKLKQKMVDLCQSSKPQINHLPASNLALVGGYVGIALSLLSAARPSTTSWECLFLLSP